MYKAIGIHRRITLDPTARRDVTAPEGGSIMSWGGPMGPPHIYVRVRFLSEFPGFRQTVKTPKSCLKHGKLGSETVGPQHPRQKPNSMLSPWIPSPTRYSSPGPGTPLGAPVSFYAPPGSGKSCRPLGATGLVWNPRGYSSPRPGTFTPVSLCRPHQGTLHSRAGGFGQVSFRS